MPEQTPLLRAQRQAEQMWQGDSASRGLGIELGPVGPGRASAAMTVRPDMVNGHGLAHGGFVFALADSAFAFACNSFNRRAVAQSNSITYLRPGKPGRLVVTAEVRKRGESLSVCEADIQQDGSSLVHALATFALLDR